MLLPLFPLPNVVHFPGTRLPLHVFEPRYRSLVADLLARPALERHIGMILTATFEGDAEPTLLEPGCAGLLVHHEALPDGRSNLLLEGQFRFRVERELSGQPYRVAEVDSLPEEVPLIEDEASDELQSEIVALASGVVRLSGDRSPIDLGDLAGLAAEGRLTMLVNRIAAGLDVPPLRKQSLLALGPLERAREVAGILRSRVRLLDALRPYRRFAEDPSLN